MIDPSTALLFAGAVILLLLSPGPSMAFVMAHGAAYGVRGGAAAALGIGLADLVLTALIAAGLATAAMAWPHAFDLIRYAGIAYFLWLAYRALRSPHGPASAVQAQTSLARVFTHAALNSLLNPKAWLFFLVFLPQFVDRGKGHITQQMLVLGCLLALIGTAFHTLLGALGNLAARTLAHTGVALWLQSRGLPMVFILLALRLAVMPGPA